MKRDYAIYQVALKIFLQNGGDVLFLKDENGKWDLPGGRIDNVENKKPLEKILAREVREELGKEVKYELKLPAVQFRRFIYSRSVFGFITVYEAVYKGGYIKISHEHTSFEWLNPKTYPFRRNQFGNDNEEYEALMKYFGR
ncbi:MAG: hypothetical protein A3H64_02485 [Candidatus Ryanbacteria bacterium RIFCSPLOWO2_02_FULL_45_11c]|uniref:Nudix hydrolase domain-containing protein n=1 Tax=Candidatus Ryanbacteria bacterium RIFCSPLOWO2_02_FULL_45_11c TaxID=1802128 RepID=A0A1G2H3E4_9BACT|nr:MAG: hypothetical protein A3H64_02485 [Candidatus Ryanbacteria bacterium RIFCSPLOWO2_02_FULL_45_11c]